MNPFTCPPTLAATTHKTTHSRPVNSHPPPPSSVTLAHSSTMASQGDITPSVPSIASPDAKPSAEQEDFSSQSSSGSENDDSAAAGKLKNQRLQRPKLGSRKSSGTIIVPRDCEHIELTDENYDENDARTMSPRRNSEEIERLGEDARQALIE